MPSLDELSPRKQLVLFGVLAVVLVGMAEYAWLSSVSQDNSTLKGKVAAMQLSNAQLEPLAARLPGMRSQIAVLQRQMVGLEKVVPPRTRTGRFLRSLERSARASGVHIREVTAQTANRHGFYTAAPYSVSLDGSYGQLAAFYARLARMRRIVNVENLQLQHLSPTGGLGYRAGETVSAGCLVTTYYSRHGSMPALKMP